MFKKIAAMALCCLLTASCTPIQINPEDLLRPPKLTDLQTQVYDALIASTGPNVKLKYPKRGEYRSAFTFTDLDNDDQEEALVFYAVDDAASDVRIKVLSFDGASWYAVYDMSGGGSNVDSVRFAHLSSPVGQDIVIGWEQLGSSSITACVYRYEAGKLRLLFSDSYTNMEIVRPENSQLEQMILFESTGNFRATYAKLISPRGSRLALANEIELLPNMVQLLQLKTGEIRPGQQGILLDALLEDGQTGTFLFAIEEDNLTILYPSDPTGKDGEENFCAAIRPQQILSRVVGENDAFVIPTQTPLPGYDETENPQFLTHYWQPGRDRLERVQNAYVNTAAGYMITFPDRWVGAVTAVRQEDTGEIEFFKFIDTLQNQSVPLLRVKVYASGDYQDTLEIEKYEQQAHKGTFSYYTYIPPDLEDDLCLTESELQQMFSLLR